MSIDKYIHNFLFSHSNITISNHLFYVQYSTPTLEHTVPLLAPCPYPTPLCLASPYSPLPLPNLLDPALSIMGYRPSSEAHLTMTICQSGSLLVCLHEYGSACQHPLVTRIHGLQGSQKHVRVSPE